MADNDELTIDDLSLSDPGEEFDGAQYDDTSFLATPPASSKAPRASSSTTTSTQPSQRANPPPLDPAAREAALRNELQTLRTLNTHLNTVLISLSRASTSLEAVNGSVSQGGMLLSTWRRMLAGTEHNTRLLLDPRWAGASTDAAAIAEEEERRKREVEERERRRLVEKERRAAVAEEERVRREREGVAGARPAAGGLGRGTAGTRGHRARAGSVSGPPARGTVTGVRGVRGGVRGGSATASGRGIARSASSASRGARGTGVASTTASGVGKGRARGA